MENLPLPSRSPATASKLWSSAILACLCCVEEHSFLRLLKQMPRYVLLLRLEYQPVIKWGGNGMSLQPLSKAAEIYSCPGLLSSSKRQAVSVCRRQKKKIAHCHGGGNLKVTRVVI